MFWLFVLYLAGLAVSSMYKGRDFISLLFITSDGTGANATEAARDAADALAYRYVLVSRCFAPRPRVHLLWITVPGTRYGTWYVSDFIPQV